MPVRPLSRRFFEWLRNHWSIPPVVAGIVISLGLALLVLLLSWYVGLIDAVDRGEQPDISIRAPITLYLLIGYIPTAQYYLRTWAEEHVAALSTRFEFTQPSDVPPRSVLRIVGAIGVVTFYFFFFFEETDRFELDVLYWVSVTGGVVLGWFNLRFLYELAWYASSVSRTAALIRNLDLFDPESVRPYAQHGVRSCLLVIVLISVSANLWLDPESPVVGTVSTLVMFSVVAVLVIVLPTWKIHVRMRETRQDELAVVRADVRERRFKRNRTLDDAQQLSVDLALEQRLMQASVWPLDAGSYGRVFLYIGLGLGSWTGAALVERFLEQAF